MRKQSVNDERLKVKVEENGHGVKSLRRQAREGPRAHRGQVAAEKHEQMGTSKEDGADVGMFVSSVEGN